MKKSILALLLVTLTAAHAAAQVTSAFDQNYGLADFVSNTWDVDTSSNEWVGAALRVELNTGSVYQNTGIGSGNAPPDPANFATNPDLQYDSYMTGGTDSASPSTIGWTPLVLGNARDIDGSTPGPAVFNTSGIDAAWVSMEDTPQTGNLTLARVTLSDTAQGIYSYRLGIAYNSPNTFVGGLIADGVMQDPVLTAEFSQEAITIASSGYVSNTWDVDTFNEDWFGAALRVELSAGSVYQNTGTGSGNAPPDPANFATNPDLQYDSYMTGGTDSASPSTIGLAPFVLGNACDIDGSTPEPVAFDTAGIDAAWVSMEDTPPAGDLMLGRVTLTDDAQGTFKFRIGFGVSGEIFYLGGAIVDGEMLLTGAVAPPAVPGDFDGDRDVDVSDLGILATNYGTIGGATLSMGDANNDGNVNVSDLGILATHYGTVAAAAVPEPNTLVLLLGASLSLALFRRR